MSDNIVFISYTKHDNNSVMYLEEVKKHLSSLVRQKKCIIWDDTLIEPGKLWKSEIEKAMNRARVAIFLVGPAFLGSEFITETEEKIAALDITMSTYSANKFKYNAPSVREVNVFCVKVERFEGRSFGY